MKPEQRQKIEGMVRNPPPSMNEPGQVYRDLLDTRLALAEVLDELRLAEHAAQVRRMEAGR